MANVVGDEALGKLARQQHDWFRRVREGSLDLEKVVAAYQIMQDFADGKFPDLPGLVCGTHCIQPIEYFIDCDADPFLPDGWKVEEHQKGGIFKWTESLIGLHLDRGQQNGKCIGGHDLRKALQTRKVLNANVLDFLLKHSELIPEEWKGKAVFFWGTVYRYPGGSCCVLYLYWDDGQWHWSVDWLGSGWNRRRPSAVLA